MNDVGVYGFAVKMASLGSVFWGPFQLAWMPFALSAYNQNKPVETLEKAASWFYYLSFFTILTITFFVPVVVGVFFPLEYLKAMDYLAVLLLCLFFNMAYYLPFTSLIQLKELRYVTIAFVASSILNLLINFALIPVFGITGAVVANLVGYFSIYAITLKYSKRSDYPNYAKKEHIFIFLFLAVFLVAGQSIDPQNILQRISVYLLSIIVITLICIRFKMVDIVVFKKLFRISN